MFFDDMESNTFGVVSIRIMTVRMGSKRRRNIKIGRIETTMS